MDEIEKYAKLLREVREEHENGKQESNPDDKILLIDGLNTFIRVFSAVPQLNEDGLHIGGITGFLRSLGSLIRTYRPTRCIVVFDGKGGSARRKRLLPEYKEGRAFKLNVNRAEHMRQDDSHEMRSMRLQFQRVAQYLSTLPITTLSVDNCEADDVIAYIATDLYPDSEHIIVSEDKDFLQLVNENTSVWRPTTKKFYKPDDILEKFDIPAHNFLLFRAFDGDKSDNIKGIQGVGKKTLIKRIPIILEDKTLEVDDVLAYCQEQIDNGSKYKIYKDVINSADRLKLNYKLMNLREIGLPVAITRKVHNQVQMPINTLDKVTFTKMFYSDKMISAIPNLNYWLSNSFDNLNAYARMTAK